MYATRTNPLYSAPRYSAKFEELQEWFNSNQPPYNLQDILAFNSIYQRNYCRLTGEEKRYADELVDALIEGAGRKEWEARVFGAI